MQNEQRNELEQSSDSINESEPNESSKVTQQQVDLVIATVGRLGFDLLKIMNATNVEPYDVRDLIREAFDKAEHTAVSAILPVANASP